MTPASPVYAFLTNRPYTLDIGNGVTEMSKPVYVRPIGQKFDAPENRAADNRFVDFWLATFEAARAKAAK